MFDLDLKEQIRRSVDIVELMGSHYELRREGRIYKCLCPWHDDHKPSLQINPERQTYKCWVCGEGGDIFAFTMRQENMTFPEALAHLADRAGIQIKQRTPGQIAAEDAKGQMYRVMAWAMDAYHRCLLDDPAAEGARRYLDDRGLTHESIEKFHLGYAPDNWEWLIKRAAREQLPLEALERTGLAARRQSNNGLYDRFKGRVLFPIRDQQGRAVALGGRVLPGDPNAGPAKYINSPETPLFSKSQMLYGLDVAGPAIRQVNTAIVMEGYTDCIVAHQMGVGNAVAVLGTALTERHLPLLKRFAERIILVLDGDEAGRRRANDIVQLFVAQQMDLRVLTLPDDLDPCDFLLEKGAAPFRALLDKAPDALEHKFQSIRAGMSGDGVYGKTEAMEELLSLLATAPRLREGASSLFRLKEEQILNQISLQLSVPEHVVRERLSELRRGQRREVRPADASRPASPQAPMQLPMTWETELIEIVLSAPQLFERIKAAVGPEQLAAELLRELYQKCLDLDEAGEAPSVDRLLLEYDEPSYKRVLVELDERAAAQTASPGARLDDILLRVEERAQRERSRAARAVLRGGQPVSEEVQQQTLAQFLAAKRSHHRTRRFAVELETQRAENLKPQGGLRPEERTEQNEGGSIPPSDSLSPGREEV